MSHGLYQGRVADKSEAVQSGTEISLRELLTTARFVGADDLVCSSIARSPQSCVPGDLVVYRIGQDDPTELAAAALARGAAGIVTEQLLPCPLPQCIVGDSEIAVAKITAAQQQRPDRQLMTIGVVGSAGKTTTALQIASLLRSAGYRTAYQTSLGSCDGVVQRTSRDPSPANSELIHWFSEAVDCGCQAAIVEIDATEVRHGSYDAIQFDLLVVAGSGDANADFGPTAIQCALDQLTDDGIVIAPAEDNRTLRLVQDAGARLLTYSLRKTADLTAKIIDQSGGMTTLIVTHQQTTVAMETALCGVAMAANHLAAGLVGLLLGDKLEEVVQRLGKLREVPGRGQRLTEFGQASVIIDTAGSPQRAIDSLRTCRSMKGAGRLWCVLALDSQDSAETLAQYGSLIERFADQGVITSHPDTTSFLAQSHAVLDGVKRCAALRLVAGERRAIEWVISKAKPSDSILYLSGRNGGTAHAERTRIEQLSQWVQQARAEADQSQPQLKIFS